MKKTITYAVVVLFSLCFNYVHSQAVTFSPNEYFISFQSGTSQAVIENIKNDLNSSTLWSDNSLGLQLWRVDNFPFVTSEGDTITNINENVVVSEDKTEVDHVGYNYSSHVSPIEEANPSCNQQSFPVYIVQGPNPVKISILDTGISDINDNSQNGFNFSINGYTGYDYINNDQEPEDDNGHGSHVTGIIADIINHSPNNNITFDIRKTHDVNGHGYISDIVKAIVDAVNQGSNVINMSFSYKVNNSAFNPLQAAIDYAEQHGVLVVASAGNNAEDNDLLSQASYPASFLNDNIISVASNDCENDLSWFSNYGINTVDVSIIGERIPGPDLSTGIAYKSGTSQSTAIVSAVSAVLGTYQRIFNGPQIKCALIHTSDQSQGMEGYVVSNGVINSGSALNGLYDCEGTKVVETEYRSNDVSAEVYASPNPFIDHINVEIISENAQYAIFNTDGRMLRRGLLQEGVNQISNLNDLRSGYYVLTINTPHKTISTPLIKM